MNFKTISLILFLILIANLTMGAIYATENKNTTEISNQDKVTSFDDNSKNKIKTIVKTPQVVFGSKKSNYFKVKIENKYNKSKIKNVKIKLKIYTGLKYKIYTRKTNKQGIVKFNTKSLKSGIHNVSIISVNNKYQISKKSQIFIGKEYKTSLKLKSKKVLKTKDVLGLKIHYDDGEKEVEVVFKKASNHTKITKAKFYLKNKRTKKIKIYTDLSEYDNNRWDLPDIDLRSKYCLVKVKVYYIVV